MNELPPIGARVRIPAEDHPDDRDRALYGLVIGHGTTTRGRWTDDGPAGVTVAPVALVELDRHQWRHVTVYDDDDTPNPALHVLPVVAVHPDNLAREESARSVLDGRDRAGAAEVTP